MAERLSACMVLYHSGEEALKALNCLEKADAPVDVYVVDNSPEDDMAARIEWSWPGVTVLPQKKNLGFGRGNNAVLSYLESDYHLLINPDVVFSPDLLSRMMNYMDRNSNVMVLTPKVLNPDGTEQFLPKKQPTVRYLLGGLLSDRIKICRKWRRSYTLADVSVTHPVRVDFATGCFLLIRTNLFKQLKGFDERFFLYQEDSDLSRRVMDYGVIIYHPDMVVTHAWKRENVKTRKGRWRQIASVAKFFWKWGVSI